MPFHGTVQTLIGRPLAFFRPFFALLPAPEPDALAGVWRAEFIGPGWLRAIAPHGLALSGLQGWCGKEFVSGCMAYNLTCCGSATARTLAMTVAVGPSRLDGKPAVILRYEKGSRFPWPWVIDELRALDQTTLLGITLAKSLRLPAVPLPFALHYQSPI